MFSAQSAVTEKVTTIVEREFAVSVTDKEKEIFEIDRRLLQLRKALHLVRYGAVTNYYALTVDKVMKLHKIGQKHLSSRLVCQIIKGIPVPSMHCLEPDDLYKFNEKSS